MSRHSTNNAFNKLIEKSNSAKESYDRKASILRIAHFIRRLRSQANLSQKDLGGLINQKQSAISRWESYDNDHMLNLETLIMISHACGQQLSLKAKDLKLKAKESNSEETVELEVADDREMEEELVVALN